MANVNTKAHVLVRDRFQCRYCGQRLYLSQGVKILDWHIPGLELWDRHGKSEPLRTCWATVDHIVPEAEGGMDTLENLVACCVTCNSSKGKGPGAEAMPGATTDGWDGLSGLYVTLADGCKDRLSPEDRKWLAGLQREKVVSQETHLRTGIDAVSRFSPANADELGALLNSVLGGAFERD